MRRCARAGRIRTGSNAYLVADEDGEWAVFVDSGAIEPLHDATRWRWPTTSAHADPYHIEHERAQPPMPTTTRGWETTKAIRHRATLDHPPPSSRGDSLREISRRSRRGDPDQCASRS
jgi:hypothetical protein